MYRIVGLFHSRGRFPYPADGLSVSSYFLPTLFPIGWVGPTFPHSPFFFESGGAVRCISPSMFLPRTRTAPARHTSPLKSSKCHFSRGGSPISTVARMGRCAENPSVSSRRPFYNEGCALAISKSHIVYENGSSI